jgi:nitrate/nitrite transport system ATP-binding protein
MTVFIGIDHVDKVYPLRGGGEYVALRNINLDIRQGEFVSLIGHSGCGKSTLLNVISGFERASSGGVVLEGREVKKPGPDRMMVFQNYSLLPWLTVRQNIALAVNKVLTELSAPERKQIIETHIDLVNLRHAADKKPKELSGGMKQRVAIARALAIRPKVLLLDEPFGALDALTRGNLQEQLMQICQEYHMTCVMVTHDVDEALLLSDRVVMLTNGPEAHIGQILDVPIPRPRHRLEVVNHPSYYSLRNEIVYFLNQQKRAKKTKKQSQIGHPTPLAKPAHASALSSALPAGRRLEKTTLDLGFVPLTDCAPLVVAKEKGFFAKHGITEVNLSREPSWKAVTEGIQSNRLDAAQMVAGLPLAMTVGLDGAAPLPMVTALILSRNGSAVTLSRKLYEQGVRTLEDLKQVIEQNPDQVPTFGVVHKASMQNLLLRYWLASGGIDPDQDVSIIQIPPSQMVANLSSGSIDGFCAGAPWNSRAVQDGLGFVVTTTLDLFPSYPEKIFGVREDWIAAHPNTHIAMVKALIEACEYCDDRRNREEVLGLISQSNYIGCDPRYLRPGLIDPVSSGTEQAPRTLLRYHQFYVDQSNCPSRSEGLWILTQLARWGVIPFPRNWLEVLERVRRVDLYTTAERELGLPGLEPNREPFTLFDGMTFNPDDPMGYLNRFSIAPAVRVEEVILDPPAEGKLTAK